MDSITIFDWFMMAMGGYVLVEGIRGKGKLYNTDNVKEGKEKEFMKISRISYIFLGIIMVLNSLFSILRETMYTYHEITPATETAKAVGEWVLAKDFGFLNFLSFNALTVLAYISTGLCIAGIVVLMVLLRKVTDRNAQPKSSKGNEQNAQTAAKQAGHSLPVSAFDFTEETTQEPAEEPTQQPDQPKQ